MQVPLQRTCCPIEPSCTHTWRPASYLELKFKVPHHAISQTSVFDSYLPWNVFFFLLPRLSSINSLRPCLECIPSRKNFSFVSITHWIACSPMLWHGALWLERSLSTPLLFGINPFRDKVCQMWRLGNLQHPLWSLIPPLSDLVESCRNLRWEFLWILRGPWGRQLVTVPLCLPVSLCLWRLSRNFSCCDCQ